MRFQRLHSFLYVFCLGALLQLSFVGSVYAACGSTITWVPNQNTTAWNTAGNWSPNNVPNSATDTAFIRADWKVPAYPSSNMTLSCLEINSGSMTVPSNRTLTIVGDYFKNINSGSLTVPGGSTWTVDMDGTATQAFSNVDPIPRLSISNATTVNLTDPFVVTSLFTINTGAGNININGNLEVQQTTAVTIPSSAIVTLASGVEWKLNGGLTINGVLKMQPGSRLTIANGRTLSVAAGGTLQINGVSGNAAIIDSYNSASTYTFSVAGRIDAKYYSIGHMTSAGINVTGQIVDLTNGSLNYIPTSGAGITLGSTATAPSLLSGVGFYAPGATTPKNVIATAYTGSVITFDDYSGIGGAANETDPSNKITWGTQAAATINIVDNSPSGAPPTTIAASAAYTQFATFAFSLSSTATATNITSVKFTIDGSNNSSDVTGVRVYKDTSANCVYNAGTDTLVGTYTPVGSPATFTATFSAGDINISGTTPSCIHVLLSTSATAQTGNTLGIKITSTDDVVNSQNYSISSTAGPPLSSGTATVSGATLYRWNGGNSTSMTTASNWTPATVPNNTRDCQIGSAYSVPVMAATFSCLNATWLTGGSINWNNTTNIFQVYGALTVGSTFSYTSGNNAVLRFIGAAAQSVNFNGNTFTGDVQVNNTTGPVTFESNATINGDLTLNGGVTRVATGATLTVKGNISVASGATFDIEPGGLLIMGGGNSLTVASGGTLEMVGNAGQTADMRGASNAVNFTVAISGTVKAQYYSFKNLGTTGVTINSGATIDSTYHLQNGSYTYPGVNSAQMLRLLRQVPGNNLDSMTFDAGGSTATGVKSVVTSAAAGTCTMTNYAGSMTGSSFTTAPTYLVSWVSETNTIDLTQEATAPASANQGDVINAGRFGFKQTDAGAFSDTNISTLRLTLTGTGSAGDVDYASLYYNPTCTGTGGTLLGTASFSGNPARADFSSLTGATIPFSSTSPAKVCLYVTLSINASATNGATVGVQIASATHMTNTQNYDFNGAASPPISLGTTSIVGSTTYWTGASSTAWNLAANWNGGVPTSSLNCVINNATNDPVISTGTMVCKSMTIGTGTLTMTGGALELYGSFDNSGTFTQGTQTLTFRDNGTVATSQTINNGTGTLNNINFNKTAGGSVSLNGTVLNVTQAITFPSGNNFTFFVGANKTLSAIAGMTITGGTLDVQSGGTVEIGASQTLTVNGGKVMTEGTNDAYPQSLTNKGKFTRRGSSGTWNFTATSGTLDLEGFIFDWLGTSGLNIGGTTNLTEMDGGQLRDLPSSAGMRALQLSTTGTLPTTVSNFGWYWGSSNSVPSEATSYYLAYSGGCSSRTVNFDQWFGDFWPYTTTTTTAKINNTSCNIVINRANSPVTLTEFKATPYNGAVTLEWTTGLEWYHKGFNIYRSLSPSSGFTQLNSDLIRNDIFDVNMHGSYAFIDQDVVNGTTYYYKLEDISVTEERTLHGPVDATPDGALSTAPPPLASTISSNNPGGSQSSGGSGASPATPGQVQLEPNVTVVAKTADSYRLKIDIPAYTLTPDSTHSSYNHASIPLFSKSVDAGKPETLARTLMLKIPDAAGATVNIVSSASGVASVLLAPAPAWVLNGSQYQYQWSLDSASYADGTFQPATPISLGSIINNNGQHYLPIVIKPLEYKASTQDLKAYTQIIVDVFLNNQSNWSPTTPVASGAEWGVEGGLRIGIPTDGVYQITYDQMASAGVIAPFDHGDVSKFKLYLQNQEQPLDVTSTSGFFSSGDSIRFFANNSETVESALSYVMLVNDDVSPTPGLRMATTDVSVLAGQWTTNAGFSNRVHLEQNNVAVFNEPYDQDMDLFVWGLYYGVAGGSRVGLTTDVELPYLLNSGNVSIQALVKSRMTTSNNYTNNLQLYVNDNAITSVDFSGSAVQMANYSVPASYFVPGKNKITLEPTASHLASGEYDMVYIDSIDVSYNQGWVADGDRILLSNNQAGVDLFVDNFSTNDLYIYDLSDYGGASRWINATTPNSGVYGVQFKTPSDPNLGRRIWISTGAELLQAASLELNYGSDILNPANQADVLYVGTPELLDAVEPLAAHRVEQGYKTKLVTLDSIYNEVGQGIVSDEAIRDFFVYANDHWNVKPRYVILLGDGTFDPKDYQNPDVPNHFPVKLMKGAAFNYGADHWFVTRDGEQLPFTIVGRIPARTAAQLNDYVAKVIAYDAGSAKPAAAMTVVSDSAHYTGENFDAFASDLVANINTWNGALTTTSLSRTNLGDATLKTKIAGSFSNSSIIHYMGHGAENMWADPTIFTTNDVDALSNTTFPVVAAMDCLNANFYDPASVSLAEKLVMKKDGGAIVFWGSTSMTPPSVQSVYQKAFYQQLLRSTSEIGGAVQMSKVQADQEAPYEEAILSWTIIGDPMVKASVPAQTTVATQVPPPAASSGGGSHGCSAFGAAHDAFDSHAPWDLFFALLLESLIALAVIKSLVRLSKRH